MQILRPTSCNNTLWALPDSNPIRRAGLSTMLMITLIISSLSISTSPSQSAEKGKFVGEIVVQWLKGGRLMKLRAPFSYLAKDGKPWNVPPDTVVDGATIPGVFWSFVGGPFAGKYRAASVIHDYYCDIRTRPWQDVHRVFYEAMLTSGVGEKRAWFMYQAVLNFGPRWEPAKMSQSCELPDGSIDFENCSVNSEAVPPIQYPKYGKNDVKSFLDSMKGRVDLGDLEAVANELAKQP